MTVPFELASHLAAVARRHPCNCTQKWQDGKRVTITVCDRCVVLAKWQTLLDRRSQKEAGRP
jgi:hypothetical protein